MIIDFDISELLDWGDDLAAAERELMGKVRPVVVKGAVKVKETMRADMAESAHFGQAASTIGFDLKGNAVFAEAELGPATGGPGSIANIAYFGGARGGGTVRDPQEALDEEADPFSEALSNIIADLIS